MSQIVIDKETIAKLRSVTGQVELVDEAGRVIGNFLPLEPSFDEEELKRREQDRGGRPLADIIADWQRQS